MTAPTKEQIADRIAHLKDTMQLRNAVIRTCQTAIKGYRAKIESYEADIERHVELNAKDDIELKKAEQQLQNLTEPRYPQAFKKEAEQQLQALTEARYPRAFKPEAVKALIKEPHKNIRAILEHAFIWQSTPQGWTYWNELSLQNNRRLPSTAVQILQRWLINYLEDRLAASTAPTETTTT